MNSLIPVRVAVEKNCRPLHSPVNVFPGDLDETVAVSVNYWASGRSPPFGPAHS
jgi:hypothetical protein